jgi:Sulfotransferase family
VTANTRLPVRLFNGVAGLVSRGRSRASFVELAAALHEKVAAEVGCDDFGDPYYREALDVLTRAYDAEASFTPFARMGVEAQFASILRNRLTAQKHLRAHPEILEQPIEKPLFILGLPRTGTTALHFLVARDPDVQALEYWIGSSPRPRPPRESWAREKAFKNSLRELKTMYWLDPGLKAIHLMTADGPDECRHLLCQTFSDDGFDCNATVPSYAAWYDRQDMLAPYREHKRLLQLIGSTSPDKRWVLKYPAHIRNLRTIFEVYPDARVVQCHRDPSKVLPSICSLVAGWRALGEGDVDRNAVGRRMLDLWGTSLDKGIQARAEIQREFGDDRFFDLDFRDVLSDPVSAMRRVYDAFGHEMSEQAELRLRSWHDANPRGKHGAHAYAAEDYGLTATAIQDRFAGYIDHFSIPRGL